LLVGGRGTAGTGYYALDVTNPRGLLSGSTSTTVTDAAVAERVLWEFPNSTAPSGTASAMGISMGKPLLVKTSNNGWVTLVTSGYNSTLDGKGRLYVLNALTGAWIATLATSDGSVGAGDAGLAQVSGFLEADGTVQYVYGGDLLGNVWKFDLLAATVSRLATLTNAANMTLPITAAPELATLSSKRMVFVGTGRLLGTADFTDTSTNSFFGLYDGPEINKNYAKTAASTNILNFLAPRVITVATSGKRTATGSAISGTQRGWYVELPAGEKANTDPALGMGIVSWVTNSPSQTSCSSSSSLYFADAASGLQLPASVFPDGTPLYGITFSTTLSSRPAIAKLPSGKLVISSHQSNNTTDSQVLTPATSTGQAKLAWRQVLR
jgi:type IV pilus assembly protein PilY1